jgi:hypothetical protein
MTIEIGDVFSISTRKGFGFLQYIGNSDSKYELVRVLEPIKEVKEILESEIETTERFIIGFPVKVALKRKIINKIGRFDLPKAFIIPLRSRSKHIIRGEFKGWHIIENQTLHRELKQVLSEEDIKLSPSGIFNDTLIIEYLEKDWRLQNWK